MFMAELRQVPIYRALNRPNLLMGVIASSSW